MKGTVQYLPKFFGTAAHTDLVDCVHSLGQSHGASSFTKTLISQSALGICFFVYAHHAGFVREVPKNCGIYCCTLYYHGFWLGQALLNYSQTDMTVTPIECESMSIHPFDLYGNRGFDPRT